MNHLYNGDTLQIRREHIRDELVDLVYLPDSSFNSQGVRRGFGPLNLLLLAAALTMTACNVQGADLNPSASTPSDPNLAKKLIVQFTNNRWTAEKVMIATGTLTNTNDVPVTITKIEATGFDAQQLAIRNQLDPEEAGYTITNPEIAAGGTVVFKVALTDAKKAIRFVRAIPYAAPVPTPQPTPTPEPTATPEADLIKLAGPMPNVDTPWGVSLTVHNAIKAKLNDPDSYKYIGVYPPTATYFAKRNCWMVMVSFRSKNGFGGYVESKAGVWEVVGPGGQETVLYVAID